MTESALHLYLWRHRLVLPGPAFDAGLHRHHAAQLSVALSGSLHVRGLPGAAWREATAFYVPPEATVASLLEQQDRHVLPRAVDPRIDRALRWIHGHLDESVSLPRVADAAHVRFHPRGILTDRSWRVHHRDVGRGSVPSLRMSR